MSERATIEEMAAHFEAAHKDVGPPYYCQQLYGFIDVCDGLFWAVRRGARAWEPAVEDE